MVYPSTRTRVVPDTVPVPVHHSSYVFPGSPSHIFSSKLKALKLDLKQWNSNEFGNIHFKQQKLLISLHELETISERRDLSEVEVYERNR